MVSGAVGEHFAAGTTPTNGGNAISAAAGLALLIYRLIVVRERSRLALEFERNEALLASGDLAEHHPDVFASIVRAVGGRLQVCALARNAIDGERVAFDIELTTPACPVAGSMPGQVECAVREVPGVRSVKVRLVWDPPWTRDRLDLMTRMELGLL